MNFLDQDSLSSTNDYLMDLMKPPNPLAIASGFSQVEVRRITPYFQLFVVFSIRVILESPVFSKTTASNTHRNFMQYRKIVPLPCCGPIASENALEKNKHFIAKEKESVVICYLQ